MGAYALTADPNVVLRTADQAIIPANPLSVDWQTYLNWRNQGNTPDAYVAPTPSVPLQFAEKLATGVQLTWSVSTSLNGTYAVDPATQLNVIAEMLAIVVNNAFGDGGNTRPWPDVSGQLHTINITQFKLFATTIQLYVNQLYATLNALLAQQSASWPSNQISITG